MSGRVPADNRPVSSADARIDELYQAPLEAFVLQRNALAKSLGGSEATRIRRLRKPSVVAWAINQLYWRERALFDRIRKTGDTLRAAQLAALRSGRRADLSAATDAHRKALTEALAAASRTAAQAGVHPPADALVRTLEALSLTAKMSEPPGRMTEPLQPAGFDALTGLAIVPSATRRDDTVSTDTVSTDETRHERDANDLHAGERESDATSGRGRGASRSERRQRARESHVTSAARRRQEKAARTAERRRARAAARQQRELAATARRRQVALARAESTLARAQSQEQRAREAWERARRAVAEAERAAAALRDG